jgi:hypothetical protein
LEIGEPNLQANRNLSQAKLAKCDGNHILSVSQFLSLDLFPGVIPTATISGRQHAGNGRDADLDPYAEMSDDNDEIQSDATDEKPQNWGGLSHSKWRSAASLLTNDAVHNRGRCPGKASMKILGSPPVLERRPICLLRGPGQGIVPA